MRVMPMANAPRYYVSLGDSMSVDDYAGAEGKGAASLLFANQNADFPTWKGRDLQTAFAPSGRFVPLALDGAVSATVRYAQIPRLKEWGIAPHIVTLTMGGNDLLQTFGDSEAASRANRALRENGAAILSDLRRLCAPNAPLLVTAIGAVDTAEALIAAPAHIAALNETLRGLARTYDAMFVPLPADSPADGANVLRAAWWNALQNAGFVPQEKETIR